MHRLLDSLRERHNNNVNNSRSCTCAERRQGVVSAFVRVNVQKKVKGRREERENKTKAPVALEESAATPWWKKVGGKEETEVLKRKRVVDKRLV